MSAGPPPSPARLADAVAAVWARFREPTLARVRAVEDAALAILEGSLAPELRREAEREAHRLAGSVGTFGFAEGSRLAREAEALLAGDAPLGPAEALRLTDLAVALRDVLEGPRASPEPASAPPPVPGDSPASGSAEASSDLVESSAEAPALLAVGLGDAFAERLSPVAAARGMPLVRVPLDGAAAALRASPPPRAVLVEVGADPEQGMVRLGEVASRAAGVPIVVLGTDGALGERLEVLRRGGACAYFRPPVTPEEVLEAVERETGGDALRDTSVLVVDDDPSTLAAVRAVLEPAGLAVHTLGEPTELWPALESLRPDALVLDMDMPRVSGAELCGTVRADPRWRALPVVFLTARTDADTLRRVFAAGADDYVTKPFAGPELAGRVAGRLERVRTQRAFAGVDAVTGTHARHRAEDAVAHLLRLAAGQGQPLSVGLVEVQGLPRLNAQAGREAGDRALRRAARLLQGRTRGEDVVGRWDGECFLAAFYGVEKEDAADRLDDVVSAVEADDAGVPLRAAAGVAQFPADGADLPALAAAAGRALRDAVEAGGGLTRAAGWEPGERTRARAVDVLVVEDDEAVAGLLTHALGTRGWSTRWVRDGREAAQLLTGSPPAVRARVVLLDVDLPGLDGLGVLRLLGQARVLDRTRVIVLTVRAHEAEVLQALEMGAFDHVPKPFSLPVLLHRVRRALPP